jgi:DNA-binding LacI/PurR family transcriptional regulator
MNVKKKVTIKDIAKLAGVNHSTVSRVLNNNVNFPVTDACREKILSISKKLDYIPNSNGRALRSGKSSLVGYLTNSVSTSFYAEILQGAGLAATHHGYGLLTLLVSEEEPETIKSALNMFKEKGIDYLIIAGLSEEAWNAHISGNTEGFPVVLCSMEYKKANIPCVMNDDYLGGAIGAEYFISLGHRELGFFSTCSIDNPSPSLSLKKRSDGFIAKIAENDLPPPRMIFSKKDFGDSLKSGSIPSAFFCYSDADAIEAKRMIGKAGLKVPDDISLIGHDDTFLAELPEFGLTSVSPPKVDIGAQSFQAGLDLMTGKKVDKRYLVPKLIHRKSVTKKTYRIN